MGKERDNESTYDYFGARYYDSRVANWTTTDPLFEKRIGWNPYNYVLRNPMILIDPDGRIDVPEVYKDLYPKLYSYLKNSFEKNVSEDKKIMKAFMETTGMSEDKIKENLKFGQGPKLEILQLGGYNGWGEILGQWDGNLNTIKIDIELVNKLEASSGDELLVNTFLVQVIILHEGAHGAAELSGSPYNKKEAGYEFERSAFGITVDSYNKAVKVMNWHNYESGKSKRYLEIEGEW